MPFLRPLERWLGTKGRALTKELGAFGVVGMVAFAVQVGCFQLFYAHLGVGAVSSNLLATVISMTVAYIGHRYWSFSDRERSGPGKQYLLFVAVNAVTLSLGLACVAFVRYPLGQDGTLVLQAANVASILVGTVIRYLAYRRWVFRDPGADAADQVGDRRSQVVTT